MRSPLDTLQKQMVLSSDPDARYSPFGEKATLQTDDRKPLRVFKSCLLDTLQRPIVLSLDPEARYSPSDEKTRLVTPAE